MISDGVLIANIKIKLLLLIAVTRQDGTSNINKMCPSLRKWFAPNSIKQIRTFVLA